MEPEIKLYIERAENEVTLSESLFEISNREDKKVSLGIDKEVTFYSAVISHAYYCIFYCAKAYLIFKGVKTSAPEEHRKVYREFSKFVGDGSLSEELMKIYEEEMEKAESLLDIFKTERGKRGKFTYEVLPQANKKPAEESVNNANKFFKAIYNLVRGENE